MSNNNVIENSFYNEFGSIISFIIRFYNLEFSLFVFYHIMSQYLKKQIKKNDIGIKCKVHEGKLDLSH